VLRSPQPRYQHPTIAENVASVLIDPSAAQMLAQAFGYVAGDAVARVTNSLGGHVYGPQRPAARLGLPIAFSGEVERRLPDDSQRLLHQHGVGHHY
jgi:hypothetical protein